MTCAYIQSPSRNRALCWYLSVGVHALDGGNAVHERARERERGEGGREGGRE
jgi:hypothetical protein